MARAAIGTPKHAHQLKQQRRNFLEDFALLQAKSVAKILRSRHLILLSKKALDKTRGAHG